MLFLRVYAVIYYLAFIEFIPTLSLPGGAPEKVCESMLPFHGNGIRPSNSLGPYRIETSSSIIGQGQILEIEIAGVPAGIKFTGFMVQGRNVNPPYEIVGQFISMDDNIKLMNCGSSINNSATHTNAGEKTSVRLQWKAPNDFLGQVKFNTTVAESYYKFWVGLLSDTITVVKEAVPTVGISTTRSPFIVSRKPYIPQYEPPKNITKTEDTFYNGCGQRKTCFGLPDGCIETKSCKLMSAVIVRGDIYEFEMKSGSTSSPKYIALALSDDNKMGNDLVTECISEAAMVKMHSSFTSGPPKYGTSRSGVPQNSARLLESSFIDGVIYCKVQRETQVNVHANAFDLINKKYYLLLAMGSSEKENGVGYHDLGRIASGNPSHLAVVQDIVGSSNLLFRLHGIFMIIAWIGTAPLGILLARYFKKTWVGSDLCGKDIWFAWHRICMVITWCLTMVAAIIIFVELGRWSAERNPHAILGLLTSILCFIQPIGALFRPAPTSKNRPLFNWMHWLGGNLAHILAIVTIFYAVKLTKAELPELMDWILVGFVLIHVIVHLVYSIAGCLVDSRSQQRVNAFPMGDMSGTTGGVQSAQKSDHPYSGFRKGLLAIYTIIILAFVIILSFIIGQAPVESLFMSSS